MNQQHHPRPGSDETKELVRQAIDIVDLVQSYLPLRRSGRNFVGLCPWHDDSKPSLQINPQRQSYKCWVCNLGGDIFNFVMQMEGVEFREALQLLADRAGINLQQPGMGQSRDSKQQLYRAAQWAETIFHQCLLESQDAEPARQYLANRGITPATIHRFHIGFAPNRWDWLLNAARNSDFAPDILERVGLIRPRQEGQGHYDWFRGRVMFSIRDPRGRPIAFGGRILPEFADDRAAKYINSPETPLFSKSKELYGLDLARDAIAREGLVLVMEGYTDVIAAHQAGIENAIAVLGTALGERHFPVLKRHTDRVVLVLDGDDAGRKRASEILEFFVSQPIDLRILTLPQETDPCDFILSQGRDAFRQLLESAVDALQHKLNMVTNGLDIEHDTHRASEAVEQVLSTLAKARPGHGVAASSLLLREQMVLGRLVHRFHLPEEELRRRLTALRNVHKRNARRGTSAPVDVTPNPTPASASPATWPTWERESLELLLLQPEFFETFASQIPETAFTHPQALDLYQRMRDLWEIGETDFFGKLMLQRDEPHAKQLLVDLDESAHAKESTNRQRWCDDLLASWKRRCEETQQLQMRKDAAHLGEQADHLFAEWLQNSHQRHLDDLERKKS